MDKLCGGLGKEADKRVSKMKILVIFLELFHIEKKILATSK